MNARIALTRVVQGAITAFLVFTAVFFIMRLSGDPTLLFLPPDATQEDIERFRQDMGWDQPLVVQYFSYLGGVVQGDFGDSLRYNEPVFDLFLERLPPTLELGLAAMALAIVIGVPVGIFSAIFSSRNPSKLSRTMPKWLRKSASEILFHICMDRGPTAP